MSEEQSGGRPAPLPHLRLDDLLAEVQTRLQAVIATRDRVQGLLEAVVSVGAELDLGTVLRRIVEAAAWLADAQYAALGVIGGDGMLADFLTVGIDADLRARIGKLPRGRGVLGLLLKDAEPLRLTDLGAHPASFGFPPNHPPMRTFLGVPIRVRDEVFGNIYLTEKRNGRDFDSEDESILLTLAAAAGVAIENARLYDDVRRRETWLAASAQVTESLLSGAEPEDVLAIVAQCAREMAAAQVGAVAFLAGDELVVEIADGAGVPLTGAAVAVPPDALRTLAETGQSVVLDALDIGALSCGLAMLVPLGLPGALRGVLLVCLEKGVDPLRPSVQAMLDEFAQQATVALELGDRRRETERLAVYEDRDRIARDLHDLVIQRLFATGMALEGASRMIDRPEVSDRVRRAVTDLDDTIKEIRSSIYALQAPVQQATGLRSQVVAAVDAAAESLGFPASLHMTGLIDTRVPADVGTEMVAVLREALSNTARHARAGRVDVDVTVDDDQVRLRVVDDGIGFPAQGRRSGVRNMQDRAAALSGRCLVAATQDELGTTVDWCVPLN